MSKKESEENWAVNSDQNYVFTFHLNLTPPDDGIIIIWYDEVRTE